MSKLDILDWFLLIILAIVCFITSAIVTTCAVPTPQQEYDAFMYDCPRKRPLKDCKNDAKEMFPGAEIK